MYKKIMFGLLVSSPLLAVEDRGHLKRVPGKPVVPIRPQTMQMATGGTGTKESRFDENTNCCPSFLPRVALVLLAGVVAVGGSAVSGIVKKVQFKAD